MMTQISGIQRAIDAAGTQTELARRISELAGRKIPQARISEWLDLGYVPRRKVALVSEVTGIPVADLERKTKRTRKGSKNG
jgi:ATP-dependent protease HslVU (ClpYQ) ATPase subunit